MKKWFFRNVCLLITCSLFLGGCSCSSNEEIKSISYSEPKAYGDGIHNFNVTKTSDYIVKAGVSDYSIIIPDIMDSTISNAANELKELLTESTGGVLPIVRESEADGISKFISLGNTAKSNAVITDNDLKGLNSHGYVIKTDNKNVYVKDGGSSYGVLWGIYQLLEFTVGYNCVAYDTYVFDGNLNGDAPLCDFDIKDSPDFELRIANNGVIYADSSVAQKLRFILGHKDVYMAPDQPYHNFFYFMPKKDYEADHPKWYSSDRKQLCLTAHGDSQEYELLVNTMVTNIKRYIDADPNKTVLTITQQDENVWCTCEACSALHDKYGTDAATDIMFINDVAEKIEKWLNEERGGRKILITLFAYQKTEQAPVFMNSDGTYFAIDDNVKCRDNVAVLYAPVYAQHTAGLDQPANATVYETIKQWGAVCNNFGYWGYTTNYINYMVMYNSFSVAQNTYRTILETINPRWIFDQGQHDNGNSTAFTHFKIYLNSQWQWDVNRDYRTLKKNFFDTYFGAATDIMQKLFDEYCTHMYYIQEEYHIGTGIMENVVTGDNFPYNKIVKWLNYIDAAYQAIEVYKDDADLYKKMYNHINLESLSFKFLVLKLYQGRLSASELNQLKSDFNREIRLHNITTFGTETRLDAFA